MRQVIIDFGKFHLDHSEIALRIYGYGLMLVLGFLLGIYLARWRAQRMGENADAVTYIGLLALVGGVLGARFAYVIQDWQYFKAAPNPLTAMLDITSGGLIYYGGLALGTVCVVGYLLMKRLPARRYLDIVAPSLMVGLAFGRMGCLLNGCCYGSVCDDKWAMALHFPMFSQPLLKADSSPGPFSQGTNDPSPVYQRQLTVGLAHPDWRLRSAPRDQLAVVLGTKADAQAKFLELTGENNAISSGQWQASMQHYDGLLRGSESWKDALALAGKGESHVEEVLTFDEVWKYLQQRRAELLGRFDSNHDGTLSGEEYRRANDALQVRPVQVHAPRYLHGALSSDQLAIAFGPQKQARDLFDKLAGGTGRLTYAQWDQAWEDGTGLLRGSESWDDVAAMAGSDGLSGSEGLSFQDFWSYLQERREYLLGVFAHKGAATLDATEYQRANQYLQADLWALAAGTRAHGVKPSQALGAINGLLLAGLLGAFHRLRNREGQVFALLLVIYPITRFVEESIRGDNARDLLGALTHNQITSIIMLIAGIAMWLLLHLAAPSAGPAWVQRLDQAQGKNKNRAFQRS